MKITRHILSNLITKHSVLSPFTSVVFFICVLCVFAVQPASAQPSPLPPNPFGIIEGFWLPDEACAIGAGWERIIFDWAQHQPTSADDWNTLNVDERWLRAAQECNREVVAIVKGTPAWATDGTVGIGVPRGLTLPVDDAGNLWAAFIRRAAAYYAPLGVRRFIIWNEPDITAGTYGYEFEGSVDDYAALVRVAYLAAKAGNPDAIIQLAGTTYWHDVNEGRRLYLDRLLEMLTADPDAAANDHYFDAVTLHIYYRTETVRTIVEATRAVLEQYGLGDKHIWLVETNASPNLDPSWQVTRPNWQITLDQQGAYLVQAAALVLASGADHIGVYKFYDWNLPPGAESFGLIRADGSRRPAFDTWRMVTEQFAAVTGGAIAGSEGVEVVRLDAGAGQVIVAWARTGIPAQIRVSATGEQAQIRDQYGMMLTVRPLDGAYDLALSGALCNSVDTCPVGGAPIILAQPAGDVDVMEITAQGETELMFSD